MREENIYFHYVYRIEMFVKYLWWEVVLLLNSREVFHATSRIMMNKYVNVFQSYCVSDDLLITSDIEMFRSDVETKKYVCRGERNVYK